MDAPTLMLDSGMPERINSELVRLGFDAIPDVAGNEPVFARTIFESLALRYASALANLEKMLGRKLDRIHMIGGATRNKLLIELTEKQTGLKVEIGETESSTVGSLAIQLAASEAAGERVTPEAIRKWAKRLCQKRPARAGCINPLDRLRSIPQGLKPRVYAAFTARLKSCPFTTPFMQQILGRFFSRFRKVLPISFRMFKNPTCHLIVGGLL